MSLTDDARLVMELKGQVALLEAQVATLQRTVIRHEEILEKLTSFMSENRPTLREIIEAVSDYYSITPKEIQGERHLHDYCHPRLIVYYLGRKLTRLSLQNIGDRIGGRDHTTIRSGFLRISARIRRDEVLRDDIDELRVRIAEKVAAREVMHMNPVLMIEGRPRC